MFAGCFSFLCFLVSLELNWAFDIIIQIWMNTDSFIIFTTPNDARDAPQTVSLLIKYFTDDFPTEFLNTTISDMPSREVCPLCYNKTKMLTLIPAWFYLICKLFLSLPVMFWLQLLHVHSFHKSMTAFNYAFLHHLVIDVFKC